MKNAFTVCILFFLFLFTNLSAQEAANFFKRIEQTRQKINFARDIQLTVRNPEVNKLLRRADASLRRSIDAARKRRRLISARQLQRAEDAVNSALKILFEDHIANRRKKLESLIRKAEKLSRDAKNPEVIKHFQEALKNRDLAIKSLNENNFKQALFHYNKAVFLLKKSISLAQSEDKSIAQLAEDEAYRFEQFYKKNEQILKNSPNPAVQKNTNLATDIARKAKKARKDGKFADAIDLYHQATRLLSRALNIATGKERQSGTRADEEIVLLDELVATLENRLPPENRDEMSEFLLSQIHLLQENAHIFLDEHKSAEAIKNATMARNLAERLLKKIRAPQPIRIPAIEEKLAALEDEIRKTEAKVTPNTDEEVIIMINYAKRGKKKASNALINKNHRIAAEVIKMSEDFLNLAKEMINKGAPEISSEELKKSIENLNKLIAENQGRISRAQNGRIEFHFTQAKNMLQLAQENFEKGFYHVSNAFLQLSADHLKKIGVLR